MTMLFEDKKTRILLVEDEAILSQVFREELSDQGFGVITAFNGEDAVSFARTKKPHLILLDVVLPRKNGFKVLEELKIFPETKDIPVIMITVLGEDDDIKKAFHAGATDYIVKSEHPLVEIIEKIKTFLTNVEAKKSYV